MPAEVTEIVPANEAGPSTSNQADVPPSPRRLNPEDHPLHLLPDFIQFKVLNCEDKEGSPCSTRRAKHLALFPE